MPPVCCNGCVCCVCCVCLFAVLVQQRWRLLFPPEAYIPSYGYVAGAIVHRIGYKVINPIDLPNIGVVDVPLPFDGVTLIVRLGVAGGLLVYSPGSVKDVGDHISRLGQPAVVVVPSAFHCTYARDFQTVYPNATYIASAGAFNNLRCPVKDMRVDHVLRAVPRPLGNGFTVDVPEVLKPLLRDFEVYMKPDHNMELILYHRPSGTLLTCDEPPSLGSDELASIPDDVSWQTPRYKFGRPGAENRGQYYQWIAASCPYVDVFNPRSYDDFLFGMAENCSNWRIDPVAMLKARQFMSTELNLSGGVYTAHGGFLTELELRKVYIATSGWLWRYELMSRLPECANVSGESMVVQPWNQWDSPFEREDQTQVTSHFFGSLFNVLPLLLNSQGQPVEDPAAEAIVHRLGYKAVPFPSEAAASLIVRLVAGGLLVYAPGPVEYLGVGISELGEPAVVVVPSFWHCAHAYDFQRAYPNATYIASVGALNNMNCKVHSMRVDYLLGAEPRPRGDGFTVNVPEVLKPLLQEFEVYQYPYHTMELVFYHIPSSTLLTCDVARGYPDGWNSTWIPDHNNWWTPYWKFGEPDREVDRHATWIAASCPYDDTFNPHMYDDLLYGMAENCLNWKVDPVAMLAARQHLTTGLNLSGGIYNVYSFFWTQRDFLKMLVATSGWLRRYELMSQLAECVNVTGATMVLHPCNPFGDPRELEDMSTVAKLPEPIALSGRQEL